jgi:hypothetical protein
MIDAVLPTMIDEALPRAAKLSATAIAAGVIRRHLGGMKGQLENAVPDTTKKV